MPGRIKKYEGYDNKPLYLCVHRKTWSDGDEYEEFGGKRCRECTEYEETLIGTIERQSKHLLIIVAWVVLGVLVFSGLLNPSYLWLAVVMTFLLL